jgi:hypothetical protein
MIAVILDGENAWEHYEGGGRPFLRALYAQLEHHPALRTVTMTEACAPATQTLPTIFPGSWINSDFYIWIGHDDDRRAWDQLSDARREYVAATSASPDARQRAYEAILIAEGSDWYWWYGDDHSSPQDAIFDELFRRHLRNVYRALERPIPEDLFVTNITTAPASDVIVAPDGPIHPVIDGRMTSYFEWLGAGSVEIPRVAGTMHQVAAAPESAPVTLVEFGSDGASLYVRVEMKGRVVDTLRAGATIGLTFLEPKGYQVLIDAGTNGVTASLLNRHEGAGRPKPIVAAAEEVLELGVPFQVLGAVAGGTVAFVVWVRRGDRESEQFPRQKPIELAGPA